MRYFVILFMMIFLLTLGYGNSLIGSNDLFLESVHQDSAATVEFQCNMGVQMKKGLFDPAADTLWVSGGFNGWGTDNMLTDPDNDSLFTTSVHQDSSGQILEFKFRYVHSGAMNWEGDPNRSYQVPDGSSVYYAWFKNDSVFIQQYDIDVTFSCNMELERLSGRFNPSTDTVSVNGDFNGWTTKATLLTPNPLNPDIYEGTQTIRKGLGESIEFKFWYTPNNWESVSNRTYVFTAEDITNLYASFSASYNDGSLDNVINQPCAITFTVNTDGARSLDGHTFAAVTTVHVAGSALPLQWPEGGWPNGDSLRMLKLYDDGTHGDAVSGDKIFSSTVNFASYTPLNVLYKYGINWGDDTNPDGNDNEAGFATNHTLQMTKYLSSATTVDTFGLMNISVVIDPVGVEEIAPAPTTYELLQNYPNPFNPQTTIQYGIPRESYVTLKVYNVLGIEVATLVSEKQQARMYSATFDATSMPSGMYFYKLTAGDFVSTKKMILVK